MVTKLTTAAWLGCLLAVTAGEPAAVITPAAPEHNLPNIDVVQGSYTYSDDMDFDDIDGSMSIQEFDFYTLLSRPITVAGDIMLIPALQYGYTGLEFNDVGGSDFDEDLNAVSIHLAAIKMNEGSPWFYGAWARAEMASDFEHIDGDDFTFDIAAGAGYRYSDNLTLAFGAAVININGDAWVCPGINFDWKVNDEVRIGLYGPIAVASYTPNEDWILSLRGAPGGGVWNITDDNGVSRSIDVTSYQVGAYASRRLVDKLWLTAGAGVTTFNNLTIADPDGDNKVVDEDMESGFFAQIGLSLKAW